VESSNDAGTNRDGVRAAIQNRGQIKSTHPQRQKSLAKPSASCLKMWAIEKEVGYCVHHQGTGRAKWRISKV
jgi:hypothetical protein